MKIRFMSIFMCVCLLSFDGAAAWFNLFVSRSEGKRILGLNAELRYVDNGTVNDYALGFSVMVPDPIWDLYFTWQTIRNTPVPYSINIGVSNPEAMAIPQLNISRKGNIPTNQEVFRVVLLCTGKVDAEVEIFMNMNFSMLPPFPETTHLILKRKKICHLRNDSSIDTLMIDAMIATASSLYIAVGCALGFLLVLSMVVTLFCFRRHKIRRSDAIHYGGSSPALSVTTQGHPFLRADTPNNNSTVNSYASIKIYTPITNTTCMAPSEFKPLWDPRDVSEQVAKIRIDKRKINLREKLQEGTYGQVYSAIIRDDDMIVPHSLPTFIKTVTNQANSAQISLLIKEGMKMLGLKHEFILPLIGLCTEDPLHPMLIYPYTSKGNLKLFLRKCSGDPCHALMTIDLVSMAIQIVKAIEFLHERGIIHRDIATRNCVLTERLRIKLTDNALARDLFPDDYHCLCDSENRPIKWLSIESIVKNEYTYSTDVWAYGVTMWELITLGQQPYLSVDAFEMYSALIDGYRLDQPKNCPDDLYKLMRYCWSDVPQIRPSVNELLRTLQDLHTKLGSFV
ncbi:tyrosine-protein kinase RYK isoform X2 [Parasteatoda tepidariorum]|uniref:tyrosine-protein kinase RYK isoform X1 n=1 Tax=Parasteatoda tepidariorum TaxID=114398 RepID=UPI00077FC851|nr:tyrosine-protein kinase RYK isoform X3 [Parasteatoda tepidariorum]XP_042902624.1 tyrosine-protein kinase RYK isoform X4 [Parasteatoda tepidariorum]